MGQQRAATRTTSSTIRGDQPSPRRCRMPAARSRAITSPKRATPAERGEECRVAQVKLKEEAAQRRDEAAKASDAKGKPSGT
ncbi:MAG TPA: hypothetical protein VIL49_08930 [Capillimicrobium sp.]